MLEKTPESPLDYQGNKPVSPKGNQPWIFMDNTVAEAEVPILWPPDSKSWLIGKRSWCCERLKAGEGGQQGIRWLDGITNWIAMSLSQLQETVKDREAWHASVHEVAKSWIWLSNWITRRQPYYCERTNHIFLQTNKIKAKHIDECRLDQIILLLSKGCWNNHQVNGNVWHLE